MGPGRPGVHTRLSPEHKSWPPSVCLSVNAQDTPRVTRLLLAPCQGPWTRDTRMAPRATGAWRGLAWSGSAGHVVARGACSPSRPPGNYGGS